MTVTHVAEFRFFDLTSEQATALDRIITKALLEHGKQFTKDYDASFHPLGHKVEWRTIAAEEADKPSSSQISYARFCHKELKEAAKQCDDINIVAQCQDFLAEVAEIMKSPDVTKAQASNCIDQMKKALSDLTFLKTGVRTND